MLSGSNYFLKQQDSFNTSVIFYIFKWVYAFNKKEMRYKECVRRIMMMKNSNSTVIHTLIIKIIINLWSKLGK